MIDLYDIRGFTLDIPLGYFDTCNIIDRDTDLFCSRNEPDARPHDDDTPFIPLGILDHHTATDSGRHKVGHEPVGITGAEYEFF